MTELDKKGFLGEVGLELSPEGWVSLGFAQGPRGGMSLVRTCPCPGVSLMSLYLTSKTQIQRSLTSCQHC